jgi:hypothetical protein
MVMRPVIQKNHLHFSPPRNPMLGNIINGYELATSRV